MQKSVLSPSFEEGVFIPRACFGAGCYWGTQKFFEKFLKTVDNGKLVSGAVGFMGPEGAKPNPTYREVCSGTTGHVEVYDLEFEGDEGVYEALVRFFFQFHDPTTSNRQGNDVGTQYASVIFVYDTIQEKIAHKVKDELQELINAGRLNVFTDNVVTTEIRRATKFYEAHAEHQSYLDVNPDGYCNHRLRFKSWP